MGSLPSGFPKIIVCILGIAAMVWQIVGLVSIKQEKTRLYRAYIRVNFLLTLLTIVVTLAFFGVAAARHSVALDSCTAAYGSTPEGSSSVGSVELDDIGNKICNVFIWVQVGFMGLLIALIGFTQLYMCAVQRSYGKEMRQAEQDLKSYSGSGGDEIPLATHESGVWDAPTTTRRASGSSDGYGSKSHMYGSNSPSEPVYETQEQPRYTYPSYQTYGQQVPGYASNNYGHNPYEPRRQSNYYYAS